MTDEYLESYMKGFPFKYYSLERSNLNTLRETKKRLPEELDHALSANGVAREPRSEAEAEKIGVTYWANYDYTSLSCPTHKRVTAYFKTHEGWMRACCAVARNLSRLPDVYIPLTEDQINTQYVERKYELELLISYLQRKRTARAQATRKAKRLALEQEKVKIQKDEEKVLKKASKEILKLASKEGFKVQVLGASLGASRGKSLDP
ncbi:hypothetical protein [Polynucleobacter sp.]|uniref:hypothetical protein n=1 Tax=Polynucleobacter sp. TaxID=2029855 RepID=UPI003F69ABC6